VKQIKRKRIRERGQALIIVAIALIGLVGLAGLVIDGGNIFLDRRKAQNAADSAALASALARIRGGQNFNTVALQAAATNGYDNNGVTNTVTVNVPPVSGSHIGNIEYIQVIIVSHVKTNLLALIGQPEYVNEAQAIARSKQPELRQLLNGTAIASLAPESNCSNEKAFWLHGTPTLEVTGGDVFVNSNNQTCALIQNGNSSLRIKSNHSIRVVGGGTFDKPQQLSPKVTIGSGSAAYPPFFMPSVSCENPAEIKEDGITMTPGLWEEEFPPKDVTQLDPGVYCLTDGLKVNDTLLGSEVLLFVQDGDVQISANANIQITAPITGENAGLLIFLPMENDNKVDIDGGPQSAFTGTILAPASHITIKGSSSNFGFHSQIVGYTIEVDGSSNIIVSYNPLENFKALTMPEVQLTE